MRILAQLSGGQDSLAAVCVAATKYPSATFDLLHVIIKPRMDCKKKWIAQLICVIEILPKLREVFPKAEFNLITPEVYADNLTNHQDTLFFEYYSGLYSMDYKRPYKYVLNGYIKNDCIKTGLQWAEFEKVNDCVGSKKGAHLYAGERIYNSFISFNKEEVTPEIWRPLINKNKEEGYLYIPEALRLCTWSCANPFIEGDLLYSCQSCTACRELKAGKISYMKSINILKYLDYININIANIQLLRSLT